LGEGGAARGRAWLWPADLSADEDRAGDWRVPGLPPTARRLLPPAVHPAFYPADSQGTPPPDHELARFDLPEAFVLVHSPAHATGINRVLDAWSWAADAIGVNYPLVWVGLKETAQEALANRLAEYGLTGTTYSLPPVSLPALAELYRRCSAVLHLGYVSPWGDPARLALACARPLAAYERPMLAALVGPAAYLAAPGRTPAEEARALGAALLTIIVEEGLAEALAQAARARADAWNFEAFCNALRETYWALEK
jgi:glycosyltransferase involved in cell wall biosynthesis